MQYRPSIVVGSAIAAFCILISTGVAEAQTVATPRTNYSRVLRPVAVAKATASPTTFPNASNTGVRAGIALKRSGSLTVTTPNAVIQNLDITGSIDVKAPGVIIKNCKIHSDDYFGVQVVSGNLTIQDSELWGQTAAAVVFDNWTGIRLNIHDVTADALKIGSNSRLQDSYIHNLAPAPGAHADGIQMSDSSKNVVIRHNSIDVGTKDTNSSLFLVPEDHASAAGPITVDNNLLGGGGWTAYIGAKTGTTQTGWNFTNNRFLRDCGYGPLSVETPAGSIKSFTGNAWNDTGAVVKP